MSLTEMSSTMASTDILFLV